MKMPKMRILLISAMLMALLLVVSCKKAKTEDEDDEEEVADVLSSVSLCSCSGLFSDGVCNGDFLLTLDVTICPTPSALLLLFIWSILFLSLGSLTCCLSIAISSLVSLQTVIANCVLTVTHVTGNFTLNVMYFALYWQIIMTLSLSLSLFLSLFLSPCLFLPNWHFSSYRPLVLTSPWLYFSFNNSFWMFLMQRCSKSSVQQPTVF